MTKDEIIEMAQECALIGMRPHLDGIYSEALLAFAKLVAEKALAEHAMQEVQRLGQEIEQKIGCVNHDCDQCKAQPDQEPCVHAKTPKGCYRVRCQLGDKCVDDEMSFRTAPPQRPEQEPVIGKWSLRDVYFDEDGEPISHRSPPQRKPLTHDELSDIWFKQSTDWIEFARAIEAAHGIKGDA